MNQQPKQFAPITISATISPETIARAIVAFRALPNRNPAITDELLIQAIDEYFQEGLDGQIDGFVDEIASNDALDFEAEVEQFCEEMGMVYILDDLSLGLPPHNPIPPTA